MTVIMTKLPGGITQPPLHQHHSSSQLEQYISGQDDAMYITYCTKTKTKKDELLINKIEDPGIGIRISLERT